MVAGRSLFGHIVVQYEIDEKAGCFQCPVALGMGVLTVWNGMAGALFVRSLPLDGTEAPPEADESNKGSLVFGNWMKLENPV